MTRIRISKFSCQKNTFAAKYDHFRRPCIYIYKYIYIYIYYDEFKCFTALDVQSTSYFCTAGNLYNFIYRCPVEKQIKMKCDKMKTKYISSNGIRYLLLCIEFLRVAEPSNGATFNTVNFSMLLFRYKYTYTYLHYVYLAQWKSSSVKELSIREDRDF